MRGQRRDNLRDIRRRRVLKIMTHYGRRIFKSGHIIERAHLRELTRGAIHSHLAGRELRHGHPEARIKLSKRGREFREVVEICLGRR